MEKKRILLVDDEESITRMLGMFLEGTGKFEVRTENEGGKVIQQARQFKPDLIVLDLIMPDTDGSMVAAELKDDAELRDTPIIFLTALVSKGEVGSHGKEIAGHPFLAKPVDPERVVEAIEEQLG
ncbi:MAG: response regulator [Gemmatimonadales bacterium]